MCVCVSHARIAYNSRKWVSKPHGTLWLFAEVWMQRIESWSFGRAARSLNHWTISLCPIWHHSYGLCEYVPMWRVSMFMSVHGSMHVPLWISEGDVGNHSSAFIFLFLRLALWSSPREGLGGCLESPRDLPVSGSTVLGRQAHSHHTQLLLLILLSVWSCFHMDPRNRTLNLNPHACKTNILLIEPTPQIFSRHVVAMFGTVTKVIENKLGRSEWCIK